MDTRPGNGSNFARDFPSVAEHDQRGDVTNAELLGSGRVTIGVQLENENLAASLSGELIQNGCHDFARPTPVGVEIDQHGHLALADNATQIALRDGCGAVEEDGLAALSTLGMVVDACEIYAI